jgi:hypothetical protein
MWWMAAAMVAQGIEKGKEVKAQAKLDKFVAKSNTKIQNLNLAASNTMAKVKGDLARYQQAKSNKYKLIAGADSVESQRTNMLRLSDEAVRGSFDARIAASEAAGAIAASAGAAGIGGSSLDMLDASNRIRQQRAQELGDRQLANQLYDGQRNIDQTVEATILGLDDVQYNDAINYMEAQTPYIKEPSWASIGMQAGMQFAQVYSSMGGFDKLGSKASGWFGSGGGSQSFGAQAGNLISTQV